MFLLGRRDVGHPLGGVAPLEDVQHGPLRAGARGKIRVCSALWPLTQLSVDIQKQTFYWLRA